MKELTFSYNETYKITYQYREGKRYLLLIHGYLQSSIVWKTFIDHLPPDIGIIAIDLPGHGGSSLWGDNFFKPLAHSISQLLEHHKINKIKRRWISFYREYAKHIKQEGRSYSDGKVQGA